MGWIANPTPTPVGLGDAVVVRPPWGLSLGEVLAPSTWPLSIMPLEFVRRATYDDRQLAKTQFAQTQRLLSAAQQRVADLALPLLIIDAELTLDSSAFCLHVVRWEPCHTDSLLTWFERQLSVHVELHEMSRPLRQRGECGSCGAGGSCAAGCGTSSTPRCAGCSCQHDCRTEKPKPRTAPEPVGQRLALL